MEADDVVLSVLAGSDSLYAGR